MKTRDLVRIGIPAACADIAKQILQRAQAQKQSMRTVTDHLKKVAAAPESFVSDVWAATVVTIAWPAARSAACGV